MEIDTLEKLEALYGQPKPASLRKVADRITPEYRKWIEAAPFCALATVGPEGTDCTPRGDAGCVTVIEDDKTIAMPDRRGNDRIDTLRNIVRDPRCSILYLVPGSDMVIRVNGRGRIVADADRLARHAMQGKAPRSVLLITIEELYFQCARAVMRAGLWGARPDISDLPSAGDILAAMTNAEVGGPQYDKDWPARAAKSMW